MKPFFVIPAGLVVAAAGWAACGSDKPTTVGVHCGDITVPGILASPPGLQLTIRNAAGQAEAAGASVSVLNVDKTPIGTYGPDSLTLTVYDIGAGTYSVRISKPFYRDTTIANLVVHQGECAEVVQTTKASVVLELAPGAPQVRSVAIYGAMFLATPGIQTRMVALVDADASFSHAVTWRVSDTTMARVDQTGLVTSKCSTRGGTDTLTAISVADPSVVGRATFGVGAQASCP
jgi:hypothetical protein